MLTDRGVETLLPFVVTGLLAVGAYSTAVVQFKHDPDNKQSSSSFQQWSLYKQCWYAPAEQYIGTIQQQQPALLRTLLLRTTSIYLVNPIMSQICAKRFRLNDHGGQPALLVGHYRETITTAAVPILECSVQIYAFVQGVLHCRDSSSSIDRLTDFQDCSPVFFLLVFFHDSYFAA